MQAFMMAREEIALLVALMICADRGAVGVRDVKPQRRSVGGHAVRADAALLGGADRRGSERMAKRKKSSSMID